MLRTELKTDIYALLSPIKKVVKQLKEKVTHLEASSEQRINFKITMACKVNKLDKPNQYFKDKLDYAENYARC